MISFVNPLQSPQLSVQTSIRPCQPANHSAFLLIPMQALTKSSGSELDQRSIIEEKSEYLSLIGLDSLFGANARRISTGVPTAALLKN